MMTDESDLPKERVFISYSHADAAFVNALSSELAKRDVNIWVDQQELEIGDSILEKVSTAIQSSRYLIAVVSNNSVKSRWATSELDMATNLQLLDKGMKVLPVLIDDVDPFPGFLTGKVYADFRRWRDHEVFASALLKLLDVIYPPEQELKYLLIKDDPARVKDFLFSVPAYLHRLSRSFLGSIFQLKEAVDPFPGEPGASAIRITSELDHYGEGETFLVVLCRPTGTLFREGGAYSPEVRDALSLILTYRKSSEFLKRTTGYAPVGTDVMLVRSRFDLVLIGRKHDVFVQERRQLADGVLYKEHDYSIVPRSYDILLDD